MAKNKKNEAGFIFSEPGHIRTIYNVKVQGTIMAAYTT